MAGEVVFTQSTLAGTQDQVFNPALVDVVNESSVSLEEKEAETVVREMGFFMQKPLNPNMVISSKIGARELSELEEGQVIPLLDVGKWPNKGIKVKSYGGKFVVSQLMYDRALSSRTLNGADSSVKESIVEFVDNIKDLRKGAVMDKAIEATMLLTKGFSVTQPYWPGSATANGNSLFDTDHPFRNSTGTFRNVLGGGYGTLNKALDSTHLQHALTILKEEVKTQRGHKVTRPPNGYTLVIPTALEVTIQGIINAAGNQAGQFAGTGSNAALINTFYFMNNKVKWISNPYIGYESYEKGIVGADTNWFVMNAEAMRDQKAMRYIILNEGEMEMWYDHHTKDRYTSYYHTCGFDHYGAEAFVVGSQGTA